MLVLRKAGIKYSHYCSHWGPYTYDTDTIEFGYSQPEGSFVSEHSQDVEKFIKNLSRFLIENPEIKQQLNKTLRKKS